MNDPLRQNIFTARDEYGLVEVWRTCEGLILGLGSDIEQTCLLPHNRSHLCFTYMRQMMLGLLWKPKPARALLLGMGGGALAHFLLARFPQIRIDAVEIRPAVVEAAHSVLGLGESEGLRIHVMDAASFVSQARDGSYDLILTDLFDAYGMVPAVGDPEFQGHCARILAPGGAASCNLWRNPLDDYLAGTKAIEQAFPWTAYGSTPGHPQSIAIGAHGPARHAKEVVRIGRKHELELADFWRDMACQNPGRISL